MIKKVIETPFYTHQFRRPDGRGWLNESETVASAVITCTDMASGEDMSGVMISQIAPYNSTQVRYKVSGGIAGHTYRITITITTSNGQDLSDDIEMRVP